MSRLPLEVADILRSAGASFWENSTARFCWLSCAAVRLRSAVIATAAPTAARSSPSPITHVRTGIARSARATPACAGSRRGRGNCCPRYVHAVFTLPRELAPVALQNKNVIFDLLFHASTQTLLEVARDPRHLGAEIGFFTVLHTWNQKLQFHPHAHCIVAAGGMSPDHARWISSSPRFFLPIKLLSRVFRGKFVAGLKAAFQAGTLKFHGSLKHLAEARTFGAWLRTLFRHDWVVYAKRPFGGPQHPLRYLGAYTHRVAISNHGLVALEDGKVTFRWRDSAHGNQKKLMSLHVDEFLRRFLLHLLPRGFVRIRNLGFLANRRRATLLPICFQLLGRSTEQSPPARAVSRTQPCSTWRCPLCGGTMRIVERISAAELLLRSPPQTVLTAA